MEILDSINSSELARRGGSPRLPYYDTLVDVLKTNVGSWVAIQPEEVPGVNDVHKRSAIRKALGTRGININTALGTDGTIYVRLELGVR